MAENNVHTKTKGGCLCGKIRFEIHDDLPQFNERWVQTKKEV